MSNEHNTPSLEKLDPNLAVPEADDSLHWYNALDLGLEGQGWTDLAHPYDRLPAKAERVVDDAVWELSRHSAGIRLRFLSDSEELAARWTLRGGPPTLVGRMPTSGICGLDLYVRKSGAWRWVAAGVGADYPDNRQSLMAPLAPGLWEYLLYLPLYSGIESLEIGLQPGATLAKAPPDDRRPLVFYGTSIVHGGCAARTGMSYPSILSRRLDWPFLNLGFSGNGKMQPAVMDLLAELDPVAFIIDPLPNMNPALIKERMGEGLRRIKQAHPRTPLLFVENILRQNAHHVPPSLAGHYDQNETARRVWAQVASEFSDLRILAGENLLGTDDLATVDGVHPTDLGFMRMADALEPSLGAILAEPR